MSIFLEDSLFLCFFNFLPASTLPPFHQLLTLTYSKIHQVGQFLEFEFPFYPFHPMHLAIPLIHPMQISKLIPGKTKNLQRNRENEHGERDREASGIQFRPWLCCY